MRFNVPVLWISSLTFHPILAMLIYFQVDVFAIAGSNDHPTQEAPRAKGNVQK